MPYCAVSERFKRFLLTTVESLVAWHQGRPVNARKKQNSQNRPKHNAKHKLDDVEKLQFKTDISAG